MYKLPDGDGFQQEKYELTFLQLEQHIKGLQKVTRSDLIAGRVPRLTNYAPFMQNSHEGQALIQRNPSQQYLYISL
jgi:hypothetical protein